MAIPIEERFEVAAPIEQVWAYFADPPRVAPCLPGAQLVEIVDDHTYRGRVQVRVGPVTAQYEGTVTIDQIDAAQRTITLIARGDQKNMVGRVEAQIVFTLQSLAADNTEVTLKAEVSIAGRLAQMGSGMIQTVSKQIFRKFAACARHEILANSQ